MELGNASGESASWSWSIIDYMFGEVVSLCSRKLQELLQVKSHRWRSNHLICQQEQHHQQGRKSHLPRLSLLIVLKGTSLLICFPGDPSGKESTCQCKRHKKHKFDTLVVGKIPWRRAWQPTPVFLPRESHGLRSLAGYSPWGRKVEHDWNDLACTHLSGS